MFCASEDEHSVCYEFFDGPHMPVIMVIILKAITLKEICLKIKEFRYEL